MNQYQQLFDHAGLHLGFIDTEIQALGRAVLDTQTTDTTLVLDMGARTTTVGIFESGLLQLSVLASIGGEAIIKKIMDDRLIDEREARLLFDSQGFLAQSTLITLLEEEFSVLVKEIQKAITYYEKTSRKTISRIVLAGGMSLAPGIVEYLARKTGRETRKGNPLLHIRDKALFNIPENILYANVVGLASRTFGSEQTQINLLPKETGDMVTAQKKRSFKELIQFMLTVKGLIFGTLTLVLCFVFLKIFFA